MPPSLFTDSGGENLEDSELIEMDDTSSARPGVSRTLSREESGTWQQRQQDKNVPHDGSTVNTLGIAKHTLGMILLLSVVCLWTVSNFLGSSIFADNTYAKPFFLTYLNTSTFLLLLFPVFGRSTLQLHKEGELRDVLDSIRSRWRRGGIRSLLQHEDDNRNDRPRTDEEGESFLKPTTTATTSNDDPNNLHTTKPVVSRTKKRTHLGLAPTARLSLAFCILWFAANYFAMACLQYTTVASTTILTSTSSIWTLLMGALTGVEKFTWRKLLGVLASLAGIALISRVDLTAPDPNDQHQQHQHLQTRAVSEFPDKPASELVLGDFLALFSAFVYGIYTITLKRAVVRAEPLQLNMSLFFGLIGLFNLVLMLPLFPIMHYTGLEPFELPPGQRVWTILLVNSVSSLLSDVCWAYAMVLTSPLVVTVGLSLTIPFSLVGEMLIQGRYEGWVYWLGAFIVVGSFVFVDREEVGEDEKKDGDDGTVGGGGGFGETDGRTGDATSGLPVEEEMLLDDIVESDDDDHEQDGGGDDLLKASRSDVRHTTDADEENLLFGR